MGLLVARRGILAAGSSSGSAPSGDWDTEVAADNPFAWWKFTETSGSTAADEELNHDGTVFGADLNVGGVVDSAVAFDGTDDYIDVGTLGTLGSSMSAGSTWEAILRNDDSGQEMPYGVWIPNETQIRLRVNTPAAGKLSFFWAGAGSDARLADTDDAVLGSGFHHVAVKVLSPSDAEILVDGVKVDVSLRTSPSSGSTGASTNFAGPFFIGARNSDGSAGFFWDGVMDEFVTYDHLVSDARLLVHAQAAGLA